MGVSLVRPPRDLFWIESTILRKKYMPFKSKAQVRFMYSQHPEIAKRWAKETLKIKKLPEKVKKKAK